MSNATDVARAMAALRARAEQAEHERDEARAALRESEGRAGDYCVDHPNVTASVCAACYQDATRDARECDEARRELADERAHAGRLRAALEQIERMTGVRSELFARDVLDVADAALARPGVRAAAKEAGDGE